MLEVIDKIELLLTYCVVCYFNIIVILVMLCNLWHTYFYMSQQYKGWALALIPFAHCFLEERYLFDSKITLVLYVLLSLINLYSPTLITLILWLVVSIIRLRQVAIAQSVMFQKVKR